MTIFRGSNFSILNSKLSISANQPSNINLRYHFFRNNDFCFEELICTHNARGLISPTYFARVRLFSQLYAVLKDKRKRVKIAKYYCRNLHSQNDDKIKDNNFVTILISDLFQSEETEKILVCLLYECSTL
jgi:hypothetical protein